MRTILIVLAVALSTGCLAVALGSTTPGVRLWVGLPLAIAHAVAAVMLASRLGPSVVKAFRMDAVD